MILIPSICAANHIELGNEINKLNKWPYLHIDIEDGNFTPNLTFGLKTVQSICKAAKGKRIDVHLMTNNPCDYLNSIAKFGVEMVTAHIEALRYPMLFINKAHKLGLKAGLALNIKTSVSEIMPFVNVFDHVFVMTAEPDYNGELFYQPALNKALNLANNLPSSVDLYADGALMPEAIRELNKAGAKGAILGRIVFNSNDPYLKLVELISDIEGVLEE